MLRLFRNYQFSQFYHPCSFQLDPNTLKTAACPLKSYVSLFRTYGHYYAKLDPLGLYNK
jgi:2-oxoglutarate dehydrogenase complex dehydrogenase (E1) component-like enzyme